MSILAMMGLGLSLAIEKIASAGTAPPLPGNNYVAENNTDPYVAENGTDNYVTEA